MAGLAAGLAAGAGVARPPPLSPAGFLPAWAGSGGHFSCALLSRSDFRRPAIWSSPGGGSGYANNNAFGSPAQSNGPANAGFNEDNKKDAGGDTNTNPFDSSDDAINVSNDDLPF